MKIGFIGLGTMGASMALNLRKAGYELVVNDVRPVLICSMSAVFPEMFTRSSEFQLGQRRKGSMNARSPSQSQ